MSSHINSKVNGDFDEWLQAKYGEHGKVKAHQGKVHNYLGMIFEYDDEGKVKVDMSSYVKNMLGDFPVKLKKSQTAATPVGEGLYNLGQARSYARKMPKPFTQWWQKDYLYANEQDPTFSHDPAAMHSNKRTKHVGLEQTHQDDEVPEWYSRYEAYFE